MPADELDIEQPDQLTAYLRATGRIAPDESPKITLLAGGVSNRTVLVETVRQAWVLKQALAKLRVKVDWFSDPARVHREAQGLRWLEKLAPPGCITPLIFEDETHHLLAMAAAPRPHQNWKTMLLAGRVERRHVAAFGQLLARIHRAAQEHPELPAVFDDRSFFESLRLEPYYAYTASQLPGAADFLHELIDTTRQRRLTLVHGDYSPKNILVHNDQLILLDHEVIHWGDPAFDAGFALAHLLSKAHHLPAHRAAFTDAAGLFWNSYDACAQALAVRHALGCLLARVAGRSTLEYLDAAERRRQADAVVALMSDPPATVAELAHRFVERL